MIRLLICSFAYSFTYPFLDLTNIWSVPVMYKVLFTALEIVQIRINPDPVELTVSTVVGMKINVVNKKYVQKCRS